MYIQKKQIAEYKERIKEYYVEEINDHAEDDYFLGFIPFSYLSIKKVDKRVGDKVMRSVSHYILETFERLDFKSGDIIRLYGRDEFTIEEVDEKLPKKYESIVATNPKLYDRYVVRVLKLYD